MKKIIESFFLHGQLSAKGVVAFSSPGPANAGKSGLGSSGLGSASGATFQAFQAVLRSVARHVVTTSAASKFSHCAAA